MTEKTEQTQARFMTIQRVFSFDKEKRLGVILARPFGWEGKSAVRVEGRFDERPLVGGGLKVKGTMELEERKNEDGSPLLDQNGKPSFHKVIRNACIESLGRPQHLFGKVLRVFAAKEKNEQHQAMSIALVQQIGAHYPRKVYAHALLKEGDFLDAQGVIDKVPAYRFKDGKPVEEIMTKDGRQVFNMEFHAQEVHVRHTQKSYQGQVRQILHAKDENGYAVIKMKVDSFKQERPVTAYLTLKEDEDVHIGDTICLQGYCYEKPSVDREGRPL
ncbi:MAG: hypothetical protein J5803_05740, partial [Desulfovibrio sp.]|nr:hypothetical protein [Desulfovibrio sp.]